MSPLKYVYTAISLHLCLLYVTVRRRSAEKIRKITGENLIYVKVHVEVGRPKRELFCNSCNLYTANITSAEMAFSASAK